MFRSNSKPFPSLALRAFAILACSAAFSPAWGQEMDTDGDGLGEPWGNCPTIFNTTQHDTDKDGFGAEGPSSFDGVYEADQNGDGRTDSWSVYEAGVVRESRVDRNFDGRPDAWYFYLDGAVNRSELDENFDSQMDAWIEYRFGDPLKADFDFDGNEIPDYTVLYSNGVPSSGILHPNGASAEREEVFVDGLLRQVYRVTPSGHKILLRSFDEVGRELGADP